MAARPVHRVEIGPWLDAGTKLGPFEVESKLRERAQHFRNGDRYCIYVHVPFCASRCSYCALYTFAINLNQPETLDRYLHTMLQAIPSHPIAHSNQAPTTVHFGGGTPLLLGTTRFAKLTRALRDSFGDSRDCEWAVETTTSALDDNMSAFLGHLNVRRIHLGIQTLDEEIRKRIRRRETGEKALEKIRSLKKENFRLSVDLLIGLEGQTEEILRSDLEKLFSAGVRMFSVCELRTMKAETSGTKMEQRNFRLWCLLWKFMEENGLTAIHLGQFGRNFRDNLYYTHPSRGEDCLALGPYAHGSSGSMVYANLLLKDYYAAIKNRLFPVRFGVQYDSQELALIHLEKALLAHHLSGETLNEVEAYFGNKFHDLWTSWLDEQLLLECGNGSAFQPSMEGSWYIGNLIAESRRLAAAAKQCTAGDKDLLTRARRRAAGAASGAEEYSHA